MPRLSKEEREQAIIMLIAGASKIEVSRRFGCTCAVVYRLEMRYRQTGSTLDRPRSGSPASYDCSTGSKDSRTAPPRTISYSHIDCKRDPRHS